MLATGWPNAPAGSAGPAGGGEKVTACWSGLAGEWDWAAACPTGPLDAGDAAGVLPGGLSLKVMAPALEVVEVTLGTEVLAVVASGRGAVAHATTRNSTGGHVRNTVESGDLGVDGSIGFLLSNLNCCPGSVTKTTFPQHFVIQAALADRPGHAVTFYREPCLFMGNQCW